MVKMFLHSDVTLIDEQKLGNVRSPVGLAEIHAAKTPGFLLGLRHKISLHLLVAVDLMLFHVVADSRFIQFQQACNGTI